MTHHVVGVTVSEILAVQREVISRLGSAQAPLWVERYQLMHDGKNPFAELEPQEKGKANSRDWRGQLVATTRKKLRRFSDAWARQVTPPPTEWTEEFLRNAATFNMHPVFFPAVTLDEKFSRRGYTKPGQWVYDQINAGRVDRSVLTLASGWALADFSIGADYTNGAQVFLNDPWAPLITKLRTELKIVGAHPNTPSGSRFSITHDEWIQVVLAHMASALQTTRAKISLEYMAEFSFIGNVYDPNRGKFNMWEWFMDVFGQSGRLIGGSRDIGGLSIVGCGHRVSWYDGIAARPLVRFVQ